ncbi:MAG: hypothetical protein IH946_09335, partial [Bacteroidetes bacterium]|nr:hypothetical protein [Bacteroidota bacterium]
MNDSQKNKAFLTTLPGIITAVAVLVTAITGLIAVLYNNAGDPVEMLNQPSEVSMNVELDTLEIKEDDDLSISLVLTSVIRKASQADVVAFYQNVPEALLEFYTGKALEQRVEFLNGLSLQNKLLNARMANHRFNEIKISPDRKIAEVEYNYSFEGEFYSTLTKSCIERFDSYIIKNKVSLINASEKWLITSSSNDSLFAPV